MDTSAFFDRAPTLFPGDPQDTDPIDPYWDQVKGDVAGFTSSNELAMLNLAAAIMPADEAYLEVGTFKGRSMCGTVRDNADKVFYAMENFLEFGMAGQEARTELMENLAKYGAGADVRLLEGDCFKLMAVRGVIDRPVGVYFYDGEHTLLAHYLALAVVEPLLADEALVLIDDATWPVVQRAHRLFLDRHPGWTIDATWDAKSDDDPRWANGLHALTFRRTAPSVLRGRDEWLRRYQVHVQNRLNRIAWKAATKFPGVMKFGARIIMGRSRAIEQKQD
ncbi:class I SAM-dependent methyltransferase [Aeromicrobium choanae]|uniref:Methyltransferase domain-containing protein n=1 Tax=Aeromicrobium choanae TaxID=1736691 RepID=A0A1T4YN49_9ACTN|nr:class I SAM-dependent methyltransferase [Aeromicrobium choanae]SKB03140.1 Methyltransferase domain-containing protein [Aeromicrobium choanae]